MKHPISVSTKPAAAHKGVARQMCSHSLKHAKHRGYKAMQFNFVVSTNSRAIKLWKSLGFIVVGCLPRAFEHPKLGYVDAYVMYKNII
jgi:ribosomal protein S18 acetylase RimI-like enzyme